MNLTISLCFRDKKGNHKTQEEFIYSNFVCPKNNKILNFPTYFDQVFDRSSVIMISEYEKSNFEFILAHPGKGLSSKF